MKRCFDILLALGGLLALSPLFLILGIAITRESPGPIVYRQKRITRSGRAFEIYKFRSMVVDEQNMGPLTTRANDPRITKLGRLLRKLSLDELPQLVNILKGDMSFVGPRPEQPFQEADYTLAEWRLRHLVLPGLTGLAQVADRHSITVERRKALDLAYARQPNFTTDLRIFILTVREVLLRDSI